uniref:Uncharacterized protein n=1 Tax=Cannabis sativa TaxID=3483 RepID=A0A803PYJ3_CANSA
MFEALEKQLAYKVGREAYALRCRASRPGGHERLKVAYGDLGFLQQRGCFSRWPTLSSSTQLGGNHRLLATQEAFGFPKGKSGLCPCADNFLHAEIRFESHAAICIGKLLSFA